MDSSESDDNSPGPSKQTRTRSSLLLSSYRNDSDKRALMGTSLALYGVSTKVTREL